MREAGRGARHPIARRASAIRAASSTVMAPLARRRSTSQFAAGSSSRRRARRSSSPNQGSEHPVGDDHRRRRDAGLRLEPGDQFERLGDRHLLRCGDDGDTGHSRVVEDVEHPVGLVADDADLDQVTDHLRRADLGDDVPGRLGVDDDQVVVALSHLVAQLADRQDLLDARAPRRRRSRRCGRAGRSCRASGTLTNSRRYSRSESSVFIAIANRFGSTSRGTNVERRGVEGVGERTLGVHLAHERAAPAAGSEFGRAPLRRTSCRRHLCR